MNWNIVAADVRRAQCFDMQRFHRCDCRSGKGFKCYNPCGVNETIARVAEALDQGDVYKGTPEQVEDWLVKHTCQASRDGRACQHKACQAREKAIDFVQEMRRKVAA